VLLVAKSEGTEAPGPRFGVVVTKRVGNAVARNRVKRVCRECFRLWPDLVPGGIDLVVIARDGAPELGLAEVRREWERARPRLLDACARACARSAPR
jgi:ribonuclease P protein component